MAQDAEDRWHDEAVMSGRTGFGSTCTTVRSRAACTPPTLFAAMIATICSSVKRPLRITPSESGVWRKGKPPNQP
jgi:hypothetical protein